MSRNESKTPARSLKLLPEWAAVPGTDEEKLRASLEHRARGENEASPDPDRLGTAERRPKRGMIYDAPLGLKF